MASSRLLASSFWAFLMARRVISASDGFRTILRTMEENELDVTLSIRLFVG